MKKLLTLILVLSLILCMAACGTPAPTPTAAPPSGSTAEPTAPQDTPIDLTLSVANYPQNSAFGEAMLYLVEKMGEYSNGTLTGNVFFDNSLGDMASQVQAVQTGSLDVLAVGETYYTGIVPELQVFELPFMFEGGKEQARKVLDGEPGQAMAVKFEGSGVKLVRFWEVGVRQLTNNVRPIHSIEDLKGLNLRTLPVDIQVKAWELFGANVTPIDGGELFAALQNGVVDGQENPLDGIYSNKLYEAQKYITLTNHVYTPAILSISEATWAKLSASQQEAFLKAADEATDLVRQLGDENEVTALQAMKDEGIIVDEDPDISGFVELAPQIFKMFTDKYGTEMLDLIEASK